MHDLSNHIVGQYTIHEEIGRGGMAVVYRADHPEFGEVAFKVLPPYFAHQQETLKRFLQEARSVGTLKHDHIVPLYEAGDVPDPVVPQDRIHYIAMEYIGNGNLQDIFNHSDGMPLDRLLQMAKEIGSALAYAHQQGFIHRDVKPSNILFRTNGEAVLADFGIARADNATKFTQTGGVTGTLGYLPPEVASGKPSERRSDMYALSLIVYEGITKHNPYNQDDLLPVAILNQIISQQLPPIQLIAPQVPDDLAKVIERGCAKEPKNRFASMAEFVTALEQINLPSHLTKIVTTSPNALKFSTNESNTPLGAIRPAEPKIAASPLESGARLIPLTGVNIPIPTPDPMRSHGGLTPIPIDAPPRPISKKRRPIPWVPIFSVVGIVGLIGAIGFFLSMLGDAGPEITQTGQQQPTIDIPTREMVPGGNGFVTVTLPPSAQQTEQAIIEQATSMAIQNAQTNANNTAVAATQAARPTQPATKPPVVAQPTAKPPVVAPPPVKPPVVKPTDVPPTEPPPPTAVPPTDPPPPPPTAVPTKVIPPTPNPDPDGDGVLNDGTDKCPETPGDPNLEGCLDRDGDGIIDPRDKCPDQPATGNGGCPAPKPRREVP